METNTKENTNANETSEQIIEAIENTVESTIESTVENTIEIVNEDTTQVAVKITTDTNTESDEAIVHYVSCLKHLFCYCCKLFYLMFTSPLSQIEKTKENKSRFPMLFWGAIHPVTILVTTLIYIPFVNEYVSLDAKLVLGAFIALIVIVTILIHVTLTFAFEKLRNTTASYKYILSYFCLATVPVSLLIVLAFLCNYIFIPLGIILYMLAYFGWLLLSLKATEVALNSKGYAFWIHILNSIISLLVTCGIVYFLGLSVCKYFVNDLIIHMFSIENIATFISSLDLLSLLP